VFGSDLREFKAWHLRLGYTDFSPSEVDKAFGRFIQILVLRALTAQRIEARRSLLEQRTKGEKTDYFGFIKTRKEVRLWEVYLVCSPAFLSVCEAEFRRQLAITTLAFPEISEFETEDEMHRHAREHKDDPGGIHDAVANLMDLIWVLRSGADLVAGRWGSAQAAASRIRENYAEFERVKHASLEVLKLGPQYQPQMESIVQQYEKEVDADFTNKVLPNIFDPSELGSRGKAQTSPEGALRGWMIGELDRRIPPIEHLATRYSAIAGLLVYAGIEIKSDRVRSIVDSRRRRANKKAKKAAGRKG
jgi:hypothetical protein